MISHELKCIFVHIPRCAGTSVETWLVGQNWWSIEPETKHLTAYQARTLYAKYWDEYLTFSIVRNPITRFQSCMKYASHFGLSYSGSGQVDFTGYHARFGSEIVLEHDHRFANLQELRKDHHLPGQVYGNILDVPLDFVGKFENLQDDMGEIGRLLGFRRPFRFHAEKSERTPKMQFSDVSMEKIREICARDLEVFGYD
jgi:hypothetical protein